MNNITEPRVTLIMPVYNAAKYLNQSIQCLMNQDCENWNLICVDDGSDDDSQRVIRRYADRDKRIILVSQQNCGPAVARARAIGKVSTEYVAIFDADDMVEPEYVGKMLERAKQTHAEIIMPNVKGIDDEGRITDVSSHFERHRLTADVVVTNPEEAFDMSITWRLHGWVMMTADLAKTYYTEEEVNYSRFNSDEYITRKLYLKAACVALCDATYFYRNNADSLTHKLTERHFDHLLTYEHLVALCTKNAIGGGFFTRYTNATEAA